MTPDSDPIPAIIGAGDVTDGVVGGVRFWLIVDSVRLK